MMDKLNVKYWYFGIIPVFICSAAAEVLTGLAGPAIGIACGFLMIRFSDEITRKTQRWSVTIGGSLAVALLFWVALTRTHR